MNRKKMTDLTINDLSENPVWEYWIAENTEYVRASEKTEVTESVNTIYLVATDFIFNNNTKHLGFSSPFESNGLDHLQPVILTTKGHIEFYKDSDWTEKESVNALNKVGYDWPEVFPVTYKTLVKCKRNILKGTLLNFNVEK